MFDFLKKKELEKIEALTNENISLRNKCDELERFKEISDISKEKERIRQGIQEEEDLFKSKKQSYEEEIKKLEEKISDLDYEVSKKKQKVIELDNTILLQDFGLYSPVYDFANLDDYKNRLSDIRQKQKDMIITGRAATCSKKWTVDGSVAKGQAMTKQNIKQIVRCFNDECDVLVNKVKFNNITAYIDKIHKSADALNRMNMRNAVVLSYEYIDLKVQELQLAYEYACKKQEEKEEQRKIREQMREEARLQKEIEEARKDIDKERKHYLNALDKINNKLLSCSEDEKELLLEKKKETENHLALLQKKIDDIDYREANKKAGYVYIISNIGSFGENVYKIGMTRRLDPMERVDELGDASVPFKFDVHAMIFSDDAPKLEAALHHAFSNKKVNMVNTRREFFNVSIEEIEEVVKKNYDKTVDFIKIPQAEQYRETKKIIDTLKNSKNPLL